jgi:hypothetical protein
MKKGQTELSFGMIFSIILIIVFLVLGFYIITSFLDLSKDLSLETFGKDLQDDVNRMWKTSKGSWSPEDGYLMSSDVDKVCFVDLGSSAKGSDSEIYDEIKSSRANRYSQMLVYYPLKENSYTVKEIEHLNFEETTSSNNPFCIDVNRDKVHLTIKKELYEQSVVIEAQ